MRSLLFLAFFISAVVFIMSISMFLFYKMPVKESSFDASVIVSPDVGGFDLNSSALTFGSISLGGSSTRSVRIENSYPFPVRVEPVIEGDIAQILSYEPAVVESYESFRFPLTVSADFNTSLGNYKGKVSLRLMRI